MKLKWLGTASILLEEDGRQLLFDPFIPINKKIFIPEMKELSSPEIILVTHGHLDHIVDIPAILKHSGGKTLVYCTAKPEETLISKGVDKKRIRRISPGDALDFGPFRVRVLKGKHIVFNKALIAKTFLNPRILLYSGFLKLMLKENKICAEAGETVVFDISIASQNSTVGKRVILMGSLNLDDNTEYPKGADLLIMPFQGRSDLGTYAMPFIARLEPRKILLDHFDDAFPPISSSVDTRPFIANMKEKFPNIPVICPKAGPEWIMPL